MHARYLQRTNTAGFRERPIRELERARIGATNLCLFCATPFVCRLNDASVHCALGRAAHCCFTDKWKRDWCGWSDSNRHGFPHYPLKVACLPVPPHPHRKLNCAGRSRAVVLLSPFARHVCSLVGLLTLAGIGRIRRFDRSARLNWLVRRRFARRIRRRRRQFCRLRRRALLNRSIYAIQHARRCRRTASIQIGKRQARHDEQRSERCSRSRQKRSRAARTEDRSRCACTEAGARISSLPALQ
jgi:hypothetical protein